MAIKLEMLPLLLLSVGTAVAAQIFAEYPAGPVFVGTFTVSIIVYLVYWTYIYPFYVSPLRHVPTVPGFPLWGQFFTIIRYEVGVPNREWHLMYGPIIRYFFPFGAERLSIADDDALNHMCIKNPYNYPKPDRAKQWMVRILGEGVLLAEGDPHKQQRKALAPGFSTQSIKALTPIFWRKALLLSKLWERDMLVEKTHSKTIEILEWLNRTTLDIIGEAGFGTDLDSLEHPNTPIREAYRLVFAFDISSRMLHGLAAFIPQTKYLPAKMNRDVLQSRNIIISKADDIVRQKHQKTHAKDKDIIALIVKDNMRLEAAGEASLSFNTMRDQVMTFLGAGHDSKTDFCQRQYHDAIANLVNQQRQRASPGLFTCSQHIPKFKNVSEQKSSNTIPSSSILRPGMMWSAFLNLKLIISITWTMYVANPCGIFRLFP